MKTRYPLITAVIPCRNEEQHIGACLESIVQCSYPKDRLEVLVVDGLSDDHTRRIADDYASRHPYFSVINNPKRILASAWNIGIARARGDIIVAMNAHAKIEESHLDQCVSYLRDYGADCVGPVIVTHPQDTTIVGKAIAAAMSSPFGVGDSKFRTGVSEPRWVDTVHFGAYRREVFQRIGHHNEELVRSQDIDLNKRLVRAGGKILLVPALKVHYYTRSEPRKFTKFGFINGYWVTYPYKYGAFIASIRHLVPMMFVVTLVASTLLIDKLPGTGFLLALILSSYLTLAAYFAALTAWRRKKLYYLFLMPLVFITYHTTYGVGSTVGAIRAALSPRFWRRLLAGIRG